jgi:hypothetical protein
VKTVGRFWNHSPGPFPKLNLGLVAKLVFCGLSCRKTDSFLLGAVVSSKLLMSFELAGYVRL